MGLYQGKDERLDGCKQGSVVLPDHFPPKLDAQVRLAAAGRTGLIMLIISEAVARCRSAMRFTLASARRSLSLAGSVIAGRQLMSGANLVNRRAKLGLTHIPCRFDKSEG